MSTSPSRKPFIFSCLTAILGIILSAVAVATPEWTVTDGGKIGLWTITDGNGATYTWTEKGSYPNDFFYSSWFMGVRGTIMSGIIIGGLGILFNLYVIGKHKRSASVGNVLLCYYMLAFALVVVTAAVYSTMIPQGLDSYGIITGDKSLIVEYIYLGGYGYSLWICWIASGFFLLASGMAFEGSNQEAKSLKINKLINA